MRFFFLPLPPARDGGGMRQWKLPIGRQTMPNRHDEF